MAKKSIKIGIMSRQDYQQRTIAIARGDYKAKKGEPKVWFESVQSMAQVDLNRPLSDSDQELSACELCETPFCACLSASVAKHAS
jgi:predicted transcriptional regulator